MTPLESLTTIIVAVLGTGGAFGVWLARKTTAEEPLPRQEADAADVHSKLSPEVQTLVTALLGQIEKVKAETAELIERERSDFEAKLNVERQVRRAETSALRGQLEQALKENNRLWAYVNDVQARWDFHRMQDRPPTP